MNGSLINCNVEYFLYPFKPLLWAVHLSKEPVMSLDFTFLHLVLSLVWTVKVACDRMICIHSEVKLLRDPHIHMIDEPGNWHGTKGKNRASEALFHMDLPETIVWSFQDSHFPGLVSLGTLHRLRLLFHSGPHISLFLSASLFFLFLSLCQNHRDTAHSSLPLSLIIASCSILPSRIPPAPHTTPKCCALKVFIKSFKLTHHIFIREISEDS